jgi:4'-phosphopantetheinyl transferase EntD
LAAAPGGIHWDRLLFGAKESIYKAWFPLTRCRLGFEEVIVTFKPTEGTFHARLTATPPAVVGCNLTDLKGRLLVREGLVLTAITVPR